MGGNNVKPKDTRCTRYKTVYTPNVGWTKSYYYDWYNESKRVHKVSKKKTVHELKINAGDRQAQFDPKTCKPPTQNWTLIGKTREEKKFNTQHYVDNTHLTGENKFAWYESDGSKTYCKVKYVDIGWEYRPWAPKDRRKRDTGKECVYYKRTGSPSIRVGMTDYAMPKVSNGASDMVLRAAAYTEDELGPFAGQITQVVAPAHFYVRGYVGGQFTGGSTDYTGDADLGMAGNALRSLRVGPHRPVIYSRADNYLEGEKMAVLLENFYKEADLDDGVFGTSEKGVKVGITGLWVPPGFVVKIQAVDGGMRKYFGHNTNGFIPVTMKPARIEVNLVMPVTFSLRGFTGVVTPLTNGDNIQHPDRKVGSIGIPYGYEVVGRRFSYPNRTFRGNTPTMSTDYTVLHMKVFYETHLTANMIDDLPVRTEIYHSKKDFEGECKKECDANYDCTAYYAIKMKRECPNPAAVDGEDPAANGCKQVCGFYEGQNDAIRNAKYKAIEPYLFDGKLRAKQHLFWPDWASNAPRAAV